MLQVVVGEGWDHAGRLVFAALQRSFGVASVVFADRMDSASNDVLVLVGPNETSFVGPFPQKNLIFGALPPALAHELGVTNRPSNDFVDEHLLPAAAHSMAESSLTVSYRTASPLAEIGWHRPFRRYDFADEWNNLGYGAITTDRSEWSIGTPVDVALPDELACVTDKAGARLGSYAALFDREDMTVLWYNRVVGPINSFEWRLVETYVSSHRHTDFPTFPVISELPSGYDSLIAARLDCDEDIESAGPLLTLYDSLGLPLSLALLTKILPTEELPGVVARLLGSRGALLSHSVSHAPYWGGSAEAALLEARQSADAIEKCSGVRPKYAVSPFHQTSAFALEALEKAGYLGCVGGNISSDPAFNLARGGVVAARSRKFVGATMQCMLHGDCMLPGEDPIAAYKSAYDLAYQSRSIFGYLDHPFSSRYQYGWDDEKARLAAHQKLIAYIQTRASHPLFVTVGTALDFLRKRSSVTVSQEASGLRVHLDSSIVPEFEITIEHRGITVPVADGDMLS